MHGNQPSSGLTKKLHPEVAGCRLMRAAPLALAGSGGSKTVTGGMSTFAAPLVFPDRRSGANAALCPVARCPAGSVSTPPYLKNSQKEVFAGDCVLSCGHEPIWAGYVCGAGAGQRCRACRFLGSNPVYFCNAWRYAEPPVYGRPGPRSSTRHRLPELFPLPHQRRVAGSGDVFAYGDIAGVWKLYCFYQRANH